jgi:hypothetical protein
VNRVKLGAVLLAALLAAGALLTAGMEGLSGKLEEFLLTAANAAQEENWEKADDAMEKCCQLWQRRRKQVAAVVDHELVEEMDSLFSQLEVYRKKELPADYAVVCRCLAKQAGAIGESQSIRWWHLL